MSMSQSQNGQVLSQIRVVPFNLIAVDVDKVNDIREYVWISDILLTIGGIFAGLGSFHLSLVLIGIIIIILGFVVKYFRVHKRMKQWKDTSIPIANIKYSIINKTS